MAAITDIFVDQGTDFTLQLSVVDTDILDEGIDISG